MFRIADNLYIGPMASYDYVHGKNMERPGLLEGMNLTTANYGVGLSLAYDSRDVLTNPHKGYYLNITQCFRPKFLGNDYAFSTTDLRTSIIILYGKEDCWQENYAVLLISVIRRGL